MAKVSHVGKCAVCDRRLPVDHGWRDASDNETAAIREHVEAHALLAEADTFTHPEIGKVWVAHRFGFNLQERRYTVRTGEVRVGVAGRSRSAQASAEDAAAADDAFCTGACAQRAGRRLVALAQCEALPETSARARDLLRLIGSPEAWK